MPKNQLFKVMPDMQIVQPLLEAFGLDDLGDSRYFTYQNMKDADTAELVQDLRDDLLKYYIPCKGKVYASTFTNKKCITILRQFVRPLNYKCLGIEKSIGGKKQMTYRLIPLDKEQLSPKKEETRVYVIDFD
jgi:hypothetical protein